jgi:hypothetical protein
MRSNAQVLPSAFRLLLSLLHSSFCILPSPLGGFVGASWEPCRRIRVALGSHWGGRGVALGWLWGRNQLATNTHWGGFDVALGWLWVRLSVPCIDGARRVPDVDCGGCKTVSVNSSSSFRPAPLRGRRSGGERSEPERSRPRRGAASAKNWSRAGHNGFLLGCHQTHPKQIHDDPPNRS